MSQRITYILILLFFLTLFLKSSFAQDFSAEIYWQYSKNEREINFGPCLVGDSLFTSFVLKNTGGGKLRMLALRPSIYFRDKEDEPGNQFGEFKEVSTVLPFFLDSNESEILSVRYSAFTNLLTYPTGKKNVLLDLGLVRADDTLKIVKQNTFSLRVKKTLNHFDSFDDFILFDSVCIKPTIAPTALGRLKNTWSDSIFAQKSKLNYISQIQQKPEFFIENKSMPITVLSKRILNWEISYNPVDTEPDTALFEVEYIPKPLTNPDSVSSVSIKIVGMGVEQNLKIVESNYDFRGDTIFLGDVYAGVDTDVQLKLENHGNIPFGAASQAVYEQMTDKPALGFTILNNELHSGANIFPDSSSIVNIIVNYSRRGVFIARYVIESDISGRKVAGIPASYKKLEFVLMGRCISPELLLNSDSVDFGNVVLSPSPDCPAKRDTVITIYNIGNQTLFINSIFTEPADVFQVEPNDLTIHQNSNAQLRLTFLPKLPHDAIGKLKLLTNQATPFNEVSVNLLGAGMPSQPAKIAFPEIVTSNAGRIIGIPIIVSEKKARYARTFKDTLFYDKTLLKFTEVETIGTASEGALNSPETRIEELQDGGALAIQLRTPAHSQYFFARDTLIILNFKTYLGERVSAPFQFSNPLLGDGVCERAVVLEPKNGIFQLDSICGLYLKAFKRSNGAFSLSQPNPNPASDDIEVQFSVAFKTKIEIALYNSFGAEVHKIINSEYSEGVYTVSFGIGNLAPGAYFISMKAGIFSSAQQLIITR